MIESVALSTGRVRQLDAGFEDVLSPCGSHQGQDLADYARSGSKSSVFGILSLAVEKTRIWPDTRPTQSCDLGDNNRQSTSSREEEAMSVPP
jgi:hypothetical protein